MSLEIKVYCNQLSADLVPKMLKRLNDYDMIAEVHPDFRFSEQTDTGFVPFKFRLKHPHLEILNGKTLKSGFELFIEDFDLAKEKAALLPKQSFLDRLRGKKQESAAFARPEIEARLQDCKMAVSFVWHAGDSFELRFASLTSAVLAELTNGVCQYPADDIWYDNDHIVDKAFQELLAYEQSLPESEIEFYEFDKW